jgi:uncharacterized protein YydD (DUF2326 family)
MKLLKLSSNQSSFRTVNFNTQGISFIVGKHSKPIAKGSKATYNGVGKSLVINIVHFCLGASTKHYKSLIDKLPDWIFILDFEIDKNKYHAERSTTAPDQINLNGEELSLNKFNKKMEKLLFHIPDQVKYLSFRSLLPFFIRPNKAAYVAFDDPSNAGSEYQKVLSNAFLLGLDSLLLQEKYYIRNEQVRINELTSNIKKDTLLKEFFSNNKDVSLRLADLNEEILRLKKDIEEYEVANDYYEVKQEADTIKKELDNKNNELILLNNQIINIEKSLQLTTDLQKENIEKIYNEVNVYFSQVLEKKLSDLEEFYNSIKSNRISRLVKQKQDIIRRLEETIKLCEKLKDEFNSKMKYLGAHKALDVILKVKDRVSELEKEKDKLEEYDKLMGIYHEKILEIKQEFIFCTRNAEKFKKDIEPHFKSKQDFFRKLSKGFYPKSAAGITIDTNDGENQIQFNIQAKIESDGSDGINNVKIFCYDTTLLFKGENHLLSFLFHDSRLFDGIDEVQKAEMFKIINELFKYSDFQYIASVNQNQINEIKPLLSSDEFKAIFTDNTIIELTDESDEKKLLGIKVDINIE